MAGTVVITGVNYNFKTSPERRQTLKIGVSIGVHGRRVPRLAATPIRPRWQSM
jgi:hypothetical protein